MNFESFLIIFNIIISENEYIETNHDRYIIVKKSKRNGIPYQKVSKQILLNYFLSKYLFTKR